MIKKLLNKYKKLKDPIKNPIKENKLLDYINLLSILKIENFKKPILLHKEVTEESISEIIIKLHEFINIKQNIDEFKKLYPKDKCWKKINFVPEISFIISTFGGEVYTTLGLIDTMEIVKQSGIIVKTIGVGKVMSAGVHILVSGTKEYRSITPNTFIMIHELSTYKNNSLLHIKNEIDQDIKLSKTFHNILINNSKLNWILLNSWFDKNVDKYLNANETLMYGIVDKVKQ